MKKLLAKINNTFNGKNEIRMKLLVKRSFLIFLAVITTNITALLVSNTPASAAQQIEIMARGSTGTEGMELYIKEAKVTGWTVDSTRLKLYTYSHPTAFNDRDLKIFFTNDDNSQVGGRDLYVDFVRVNGNTFQSESTSVESTGSWSPNSGCERGYKISQALNCNGYLHYNIGTSGGGIITEKEFPDLVPYAPDTTTPDYVIAAQQANTANNTSSSGGVSSLVTVSNGYGYVLDNPIYYGLPVGNGVGQSNINLQGSTMVANRFTAKKSGSIVKASFNMKVDNERPGYSGGNNGAIEVSIQPVDASGNPTGTKLASAQRFGLNSFSGGNGGGMTVTFSNPAALVKDTRYAIVWDNIDPSPDSNWFALNFFFGGSKQDSPPLSWSEYHDTVHEKLFTDNDKYDILINRGGGWSNTGQYIEDHSSWFEVIYSDSDAQGLGYLGGVPTEGYPVGVGSSIGQYFTPPSTFSTTKLYFSPGYRGPTNSTSFSVSITGGGVNASASGSLSANNVGDWIEFTIPKTTFNGGTKYTAMFTLTGGPSVTFRLPLAPAHDEWTTSTAGWTNAGVIAPGNAYDGESSDLSMYFLKDTAVAAPNPGPGGPATGGQVKSSIKRVFAVGDSILNAAEFRNGLKSAMAASGIDLVKVTATPGWTLSHGLEALRSDTATIRSVDTVYMQLCVNGDEPNWGSIVDQVISTIKSANPSAKILWSNCYNFPWKYDWLYEGRVRGHNQILSSEAAAGRIILIDWATYAAQHPEIFNPSDGVHIYDNESHFIAVIMAKIGTL